jgi:hypothetical protein
VGWAHRLGPAPRVLLGFLILTLPAASAVAAAPSDPAYLQDLISSARERDLAQHREWSILLHYQRNRVPLALPGVTSVADSPEFFLAEDGKTDPQAELEATLAAFFQPEEATLRLGDHPQCAYPARRAFLDRELGFDRAHLPWRDCPQLDAWREGIGAVGVTLIFAEAFMNNPSSMFGHTLVRLDQLPLGEDQRRRDLLAYAVNFAGEIGPNPGALYVVRGVAGGYPGFFSLVPYYEKINRYNEWESRDLWEYGLDFSPEEVDRLLMHLWELRNVAFQYFFFSENCSYQLLGLLEAARPSLELTARIGPWVIPVDTVRDIVDQAGMAQEVHWRPSAVTRIRQLAEPLSSKERRLAREVSEGAAQPDDPRLEALDDETRAAVLALAHDRLVYLGKKGDVEGRRRTLAILRARAQVPVKGDPGAEPARPTVSPDRGHGSARLRIEGGWHDEREYVELRLRPAFHDLLDPQGGFLEGAQIDFLDVAVRFFPDDSELKLHEATLIDMVSLAPRDALFDPVSWKFRTGLTTKRMPSVGDDLRDGKLWRSAGGAGVSLRPWNGALAYLFLDATFDVSGKLDDDWALGAGTSVGLLFGDENDRWRGHVFARATRYFAGDTRTALELGLEQRIRIGRSQALGFRVSGERDFRETWFDAGLFWNFFF